MRAKVRNKVVKPIKDEPITWILVILYIYMYIYIYISKGLQCALTAITIVALWQSAGFGGPPNPADSV